MDALSMKNTQILHSRVSCYQKIAWNSQIPSDIPLACLNENISIVKQKIKKYFDSDEWAAVQHVYEAVRSACIANSRK